MFRTTRLIALFARTPVGPYPHSLQYDFTSSQFIAVLSIRMHSFSHAASPFCHKQCDIFLPVVTSATERIHRNKRASDGLDGDVSRGKLRNFLVQYTECYHGDGKSRHYVTSERLLAASGECISCFRLCFTPTPQLFWRQLSTLRSSGMRRHLRQWPV
jgi:hypothetical protein